ncbi:MAG TPA: homocysteine S-methyltransferase family protein [Clostridia bacterium]|nr:homocysteine S-methyltransferase family protein [Clostridia bacterium]HRX41695.1 homocysteine S-methyltransferase family protein [Clostridia bacterium]
MGFLDQLKERILIFDGSKGYMLQLNGLNPGEAPDHFNLTHPEIVENIHREYVLAGCDVIQTNTFTANRVMLGRHGLSDKTYDINFEGARLAVKAARGEALVAASIGPTGILFKPFGDLDYDTAFDIFKEQVAAVYDGGVDIINFETFTDIMEMKAALNAARSVCDLPVICSMAFEENKRTLMGTKPLDAAYILLKAGADMVGANCSFGPGHMLDIVREMAMTGTFLSVKPNAGLPRVNDGKTVYDQCSADFASEASLFAAYNARLIGGCCGTTPDFISELKKKIKLVPYDGNVDHTRRICSSANCVDADGSFTVAELNIHDQMTADDISDELMELCYGDADAIEISYSGKDDDLMRNVILENHSAMKKPLIVSGNNHNAIKNALTVYPGVAGLRKEIPGARGAIII